MAVVIAALLPVFFLIVLGFILKRTLIRPDTQWHGLERLTYYVLLPVFLIQTLVKADLSTVPVGGVGGAMLLSVLAVSLVCLALRPLLARAAVDGPAFTSIFQGATRWQTYVALAVSGSLFGNLGLALASVAMIAIVPLANVLCVTVLAQYASAEKRSAGSIVVTVVSNPLIWACVVGLALNVTHVPLPRLWHEVADALGRSSLAIGLLVTGAGLQLEGLFRPSLAASVAVLLKLVLMPAIAVALAVQFGITGSNLAVVTVCSAVPTASSAYVLARQMGGDAPLLAQIITLQTILAAANDADRDCAGRHVLAGARKPKGLNCRGQVIDAVQDDRQPGRVGAVAQISQQHADRKHLAEKEPVVLQMQRGPGQRRQQDGAGDAELRFRPAAVEKPARKDLLPHRPGDAEGDHQKPERAVGLGRFHDVAHEARRRVAPDRLRQQLPAPDKDGQRGDADEEIAP